MFRKTMIGLFAIASVSMLAPELAAARGGGGGHSGGGGGHGGSYGGGRAGFSSGNFSAARVGAGAVQGSSFGNSFARSTAVGAAGVQGGRFAAVQGSRFAGHGFRHDHDGFRHGRRFVGGFVGPDYYYDDYYDYPYSVADDTYYDDGGCYVVRRRVHTSYGWRIRPVQVCG